MPLDGSNINGLYMATLTTLNPDINGTVPGTAVVIREGDKFQAYVKASAGPGGIWHQQNIHLGSRCPNQGDDLNADGVIDIEEGQNAWGNVIIPLDGDLSSQDAGKNRYPVGDEVGNYFYERFTNFDIFYKDLKGIDRNPADHISKLAPSEGFQIEGKVIVILGAGKDANLPATVASRSPYKVNQTFPIACGIFQKITQIPNDIGNGTDTGTIGDTDNEPNPPPTPEPPTNPAPEENDENEEDDDLLGRLSDWWRRRWGNLTNHRRPRLDRGNMD